MKGGDNVYSVFVYNDLKYFKHLDLKDLPKGTAIVDFSDAGEIGYLIEYTPETLLKTPTSVNEILMAESGGLGLWNAWEKTLKPKENDTLIVLGCPKRTSTLNDTMTHYKSFNSDTMEKLVISFIKWLKQHYDTIYILVAPVATTALNKAIYKFFD